jgi:IS30 family transposase
VTAVATPKRLPPHTRPGTLTRKECARIKELRDNNLTLTQIAARMRVSEATVRRVLKGSYTPSDYLMG